MKMNPIMLIVGGMMVFWASCFVIVFLPMWHLSGVTPSEIWRPLTEKEEAGHKIWVNNGCHYCHSQFVRVMDWGLGAERIAQPGDYYGREPAILGTTRTGPDLSQAGGEHPDDWHLAHFVNPRYTSPVSVMPSWEFLGRDAIDKLTAFIQSEGMKAADKRVARQNRWRAEAQAAFAKSYDENVAWIHAQVPEPWRKLPNPYPATPAGLARAEKMYQQFCVGCHGSVGDGQGPAAPYLDPEPLNFTGLRRNMEDNRYIGGIFYYQIMNGITGTAMPYFKRALESEKIWDLSNYLAVNFLGYTDADLEPKGIDASYEPEWENTFQPPDPEEVRKR